MGNRNEPRDGAPAQAAFKLRFHHLYQSAAANGTRARRPANHRRASYGRGPMAAPVLGAWAKRLLSLGRGVCAGVGADSWLGCTGPRLFCRGFCVRRWLGFVCASFRCAPWRKSRPRAVRLGGGSAAPHPPPRARSERAGVSGGCNGCGEGDSPPPRCRSSWKTPRS